MLWSAISTSKIKQGDTRNWTRDLSICSRMLYPWAISPSVSRSGNLFINNRGGFIHQINCSNSPNDTLLFSFTSFTIVRFSEKYSFCEYREYVRINYCSVQKQFHHCQPHTKWHPQKKLSVLNGEPGPKFSRRIAEDKSHYG